MNRAETTWKIGARLSATVPLRSLLLTRKRRQGLQVSKAAPPRLVIPLSYGLKQSRYIYTSIAVVNEVNRTGHSVDYHFSPWMK